MNDKEKQIEEMAKVIESVKLYGKDNYSRIVSHDSVLELAEELLKHYQPKLPEDSVVLTREEYQKNILKANSDGYGAGKIEARKETAEKILQKIKEIKTQDCGYTDWLDDTYFGDEYQKLAKQFGVEIKELEDGKET